MTLLDSNIIIYSLDKSSPKYYQSQKFINNNIDELCLAHQNLTESLRVLTHPKLVKPMSSERAFDAVWRFSNSLVVISPNIDTIYVFHELVMKYKIVSNQIFDAYLVATMLSNGIQKIATDNVRDFKKYKEIEVVNPF